MCIRDRAQIVEKSYFSTSDRYQYKLYLDAYVHHMICLGGQDDATMPSCIVQTTHLTGVLRERLQRCECGFSPLRWYGVCSTYEVPVCDTHE